VQDPFVVVSLLMNDVGAKQKAGRGGLSDGSSGGDSGRRVEQTERTLQCYAGGANPEFDIQHDQILEFWLRELESGHHQSARLLIEVCSNSNSNSNRSTTSTASSADETGSSGSGREVILGWVTVDITGLSADETTTFLGDSSSPATQPAATCAGAIRKQLARKTWYDLEPHGAVQIEVHQY
jgi:hypothetical protein